MSFAAGARVANNQNVAISRIEEEGKFRADRLAQVARAEEARTNANTISNNAKTATTTINANASIEAEKAKRGDKGKTSMAGKLAGGAVLIGAGVMQLNKKQEDNELLIKQKEILDTQIEQLRSMDQRISEGEAAYSNMPKGDAKYNATDNESKPGEDGTISTNISARPAASSQGVMSKQSVKDLAISTGFTPQDASIVVGIASGESGLDPTNSTKRKIPGQQNLWERDGEDSVGLMQINWGFHKDRGWLQKLGITKREQLLHPATNMKAAKYLFDQKGTFNDWTVYNEGIYEKHM